MAKELYVGNLNFSVTAADLVTLFEVYGPVRSVRLGYDRGTGRSAGFGFVEMGEGADAALRGLGGTEYLGRALTVRQVMPRTAGPRPTLPDITSPDQVSAVSRTIALEPFRRRGRPSVQPAHALLVCQPANRLAPAGGPATGDGPSPVSARRVLCIDRHPDTAGSLARLLRQSGFDARGCADGPSALVELTDWRPHACVIDLHLPAISGYELAEWVRAELGGLVLLIGVADGADEDVDRRATDAGFDLVFARPADPELLIGLLAGHGTGKPTR